MKEQEHEEIEHLAKPLQQLLIDKYNPYNTIIITDGEVKIVSTQLNIPFAD